MSLALLLSHHRRRRQRLDLIRGRRSGRSRTPEVSLSAKDAFSRVGEPLVSRGYARLQPA